MDANSAHENTENACAQDQCSTCPSKTRCLGHLNPSGSSLSQRAGSTLQAALCSCVAGTSSWPPPGTSGTSGTRASDCVHEPQVIELGKESFVEHALDDQKFFLLSTRFFIEMQFRTRSKQAVIFAAYPATETPPTNPFKFFYIRV